MRCRREAPNLTTRPNIIEIIWHDLGDWLSCYHRPDVPSPCLQAFADEAVVFENHFGTAPLCSPSRASLKTGRYPQSNGILGLTHRGWRYREGEKDMPLFLREAGYETFLCGTQHERHDLSELTYRHVFEKQPVPAGRTADMAVEFLSARASQAQPFFLSVGFHEVHRPYGTHYDPVVAERLMVPGFLPDEPIVRKDMATFYECIRKTDAAVGRILDALRHADFADHTLVYFTSDHGPEFPRAKATLYAPGIKVALIMKCTGLFAPGTRVSELTSHVDVLPTLLEAAGVPIGEEIQGRSFLRLLTGGEYEPRDAIFAQDTWHGGEYEPMRCVRTRRHGYIRNYLPGWPVQMAGTYVQRYGEEFINSHFAHPRPAEGLYDLEADPWERHNLAGNPECRDIQQKLSDRLDAWLKQVDDPILQGPVPCADPAKVGQNCVWAKFPPHDPTKGNIRFGIVKTEDYVEQPL